MQLLSQITEHQCHGQPTDESVNKWKIVTHVNKEL